ERFVNTVAGLEPIGVPGGYVDPDSQSIYVAHVPIPRAGKYWLVARPIGGDVHIAGIHDIEVKERSGTPAVGSRAIAARTPTPGSAPIRLLTTPVPPDRALFRYSAAASLPAPGPFGRAFATSLAAQVPLVVAFATPRFCTSRTCGPVVDVVDRVRRDLAETPVRFIHVEIYKDNNPAKGENEWVRHWHLPSEPWTFLVGRDGRIKAKFEGSLSRAELESSVRKHLLVA